jgi:hypothetical protein
LSVAEGHVLVRLGAPEVGDGSDENRPAVRESFLVCLSLRPDRSGRRLRWLVKPAAVDQSVTIFEGSPVVHGGRVYIAVTRFSANQAITGVHCYALHSDVPEPLPVWRQDVCIVRADKPYEPRLRHHLLTAAGPLLVYASHAGALVALDAVTGRHAWAIRYPGEPSDKSSLHDLAPCIYSDGRIYAAPIDADRLFCLDAATGQTCWERDRVSVVHLLGVGQGRVIFTTPDSIRAVGSASGSDADGWYQPGGAGRWVPYGRGLLHGDLVLWPTSRFGLQVLRQQDGQPPLDLDPVLLQRLRRGNFAMTDECLAVTDQDELILYTATTAASRAGPADSHGVFSFVRGSPRYNE